MEKVEEEEEEEEEEQQFACKASFSGVLPFSPAEDESSQISSPVHATLLFTFSLSLLVCWSVVRLVNWLVGRLRC